MEKTILVWREEDRRCEGPFSENELQEWYKRGVFTPTSRFVLGDGTIKTLTDLMVANGSSYPFYFRTVRETVLYDNFVQLLEEHRNAIENIKKQREKIQTMEKKMEELEGNEKKKKNEEQLSFQASSLSISPLEAYDFVLNSEYCMSEKERSVHTVMCPSSSSSSYETALCPSSSSPSCETALSPQSGSPSSEAALCQPSPSSETALCQPSPSSEAALCQPSPSSETALCQPSPSSETALCQPSPSSEAALCQPSLPCETALCQPSPSSETALCQPSPSSETALCQPSPSSETALCQPSPSSETALCQPSPSFETTNYVVSSESNTSSCVESTDSFDGSIPMLKSIGYELMDCEQTRSFLDTNERYGMEWNEESGVRETTKYTGVRETTKYTGVRETTKCTHCETLREYMEKEIEGLKSEKRALQVETTILSDLLFESSQEKETNNNEKTVQSNMDNCMGQTVEGKMERELMSILEYEETMSDREREEPKDSDGCGHIQKGGYEQGQESIPSLPSIASSTSTSSSSHLINSPLSKLLHICTQRDTPMDSSACSGCYRLKRMISQYVAYEIRSALCKV